MLIYIFRKFSKYLGDTYYINYKTFKPHCTSYTFYQLTIIFRELKKKSSKAPKKDQKRVGESGANGLSKRKSSQRILRFKTQYVHIL